MTTPTRTYLDPRYSDPEAVPTPWETTESVLQNAQISWISTVRPDGRPHVTPLVAVWVDGRLFFGTGEKEVKYANLVRNPHVVLTTGDGTWDRGLDVMVQGEAIRILDMPTLSKAAEGFREKWGGWWDQTAVEGGFQHGEGGSVSIVFGVQPAQIHAFSKGEPFGQTTYWFG